MNLLTLSIIVIIYLAIIAFLGYKGYKSTKTTSDYLIGGRNIHPYVMAISYGATFISTSAIIGFGGAAAIFGMGLLWLTFLNIAIGIFIAFVFFGKRTRIMGYNLDAHTFPELLGKRFQSRFLQGASGLLIFIGMPLYAAVVLMGAGHFIAQTLSISYEASLFFFTSIIAIYVIMGGIKGVMYTDAFQGSVMFLGMAFLLIITYHNLGGIIPAHQKLTALAPIAQKMFGKAGHMGWTAMPQLFSKFWWILVSTIILGVGIGVLAQPQLVVRFMTVKSNKELNRAVFIGGIFILMMTGVAFIAGSLSNAFFYEKNKKVSIVVATQTVYKEILAKKGIVENKNNTTDSKKTLSPEEEEEKIKNIKKAALIEAKGKAVGNIIPIYIKESMPKWFVAIFMITLLSAAMSTLSSQFHTMGTSIGRDFFEKGLNNKTEKSIIISQGGILLAIVLSLFLAYMLPKFFEGGTAIIARGTAIFFGLCAAAFLPIYIGSLYSKRITKSAAIAGFLTGFIMSAIWLLFFHVKESKPLLLCNALFGVPTLAGKTKWAVVDPILIALPISAIVTYVVTLFTKPPKQEHLDKCFSEIQ